MQDSIGLLRIIEKKENGEWVRVRLAELKKGDHFRWSDNELPIKWYYCVAYSDPQLNEESELAIITEDDLTKGV
jgi:hypothetical protein